MNFNYHDMIIFNHRTQTMTLRWQVCGAPGDVPCEESHCGGAGCRDDEGNRHCGGLNCNGAVAVAENARERVKHAEKQLHRAMEDVKDLSTKVGSVWGRSCLHLNLMQ